ncbi:MAG: DUF3500 domain-containing protein [Gemmataceae bacterium]
MKAIRLFLAVAVFGAVSGLAYVAQQTNDAGAKIAAAANDWLGTLDKDQRQKATFSFDSKERTNWNFVPLQEKPGRDVKTTRKGLPLAQMSADQKKAAMALVKTLASSQGAETAMTIMGLEAILRDLESKNGSMVRNPEWYFFTVFGTPSKSEKWGLRVEGHHLSLNFTLEGTQVVAATPYFFGANPAEIKSGEKKGQKVLGNTDDLANQLFTALDAGQQKIALQAKHFGEPDQKEANPKVGTAVGIAYAKLTDDQKGKLMKLIQHYTDRMPQDVGEAELKRVRDGGLEKIHFAYSGSPEAGKGHTYRVQGPTFVIEFLNIQADSAGNAANHIHSSWRRLQGDFGL